MNPADRPDDFSAMFAADGGSSEGPAKVWKVLLVDDAPDMHAVLRLALLDTVVEGRALQLLDAASAAEARAILATNPDIALVLLDVVMETSDAGLTLVRHIRQEIGNHLMRIVLLSGQPGYAPPREVITNYEIDDYQLKSELTAERLFCRVYGALRTYGVLVSLEEKRPIEQLAADLGQANESLSTEIAERKLAQELAESQMQDLVALNRKLEDAHVQLLQSEKMASIGLLAAGVAHEINNPIGFVNSNLGTLKGYVDDFVAIIDAYAAAEAATGSDEETRFASVKALKQQLELDYLKQEAVALLAESNEGLDRVKRIIQSLKDFSRVETVETWRADDLRKGLESTLSVVWNELKYKCEVRKEYGELPLVECVLSHLNQVFMNLLVNAAHAIEDRGVVTIRTSRHDEEAWVEIVDTGTGITPENLPHIFDPFFTTKAIGKGSGLGLALSYGIIEKHHGRIEVETEWGRGSTFRICLPLRQPTAGDESVN